MKSNRLINESSPYLLQHAHNPVDWYPWSEEALQASKDKDLPILLSIGYSACHWCHVMERESFEDEKVASYMNEHFINIKVDREERPDLDHIYMEAVQAISGSGGWPLNVFLTPETKPFYGGTYFPPQKAGNRSSWLDILAFITGIWKSRRGEIIEQAETLINHINSSGKQLVKKNSIHKDEESTLAVDGSACRLMAENMLSKADKNYGGFGSAPKFPQTFTIQFLLQYGHFFKNESALNHAVFSLKQMLQGGIYDQIAGGLARYSTDEAWLAPHFEKMLYDNALLLITCCDAYLITEDAFFKNKIHQTISFLKRSMLDKNGGFYAALDADSEGEEGKFYVWEATEIADTVDKAELFSSWYGVKKEGNWEAKNILHVRKEAEVFARENKISIEDLESIISEGNASLLAVRDKRIHPSTDDKILLGWNALLVTALCKAYASLGVDEYKDMAIQLHVFIEKAFRNPDGSYTHTYKNGVSKYPAFLDDYAYLIQACIHLQEITSEQNYLHQAREICTYVDDHFEDTESGLYHFTPEGQSDIVLRKTEIYDGAVPSGNSVMTENLFYLSIVFDNKKWFSKAEQNLKNMQEVVTQYPTSFGYWASVFLKQFLGMHEIVVTGQDINSSLKEVLKIYLPHKILQSSNRLEDFPLLQEKDYEERVTFYLCRQYACSLPVSTAEALKKELFKEYLNINVHNI